MSAINFVVRGDAGTIERGALGASGSDSVVLGAGQDISLNLQRNNVISYTRSGQALQVTLVDGQVITLQGFFSPDGVAENRLFLSASGQLAEVELIPGEGNLLYGQYTDADSFGKWSADDALYFTDDGGVAIAGVEPSGDGVGATMLGALPLLGGLGGLGSTAAIAAAGLGGALLLGGDSEGGSSPDAPVVALTTGVKSVDHTFDENDYANGIEIGGTGTPGASGVVTVGDTSKEFLIDEDGNWTLVLTPDEIASGDYEADITVTVTNGDGSSTAKDVLVIDTETTVSVDTSAAGGDGTVNADEHADGVTVGGLAEAGATVVVTIEGAARTVTADADGSWTASFSADEVPVGTYDLAVTAEATDAFGNMASAAGSVRIDTEVDVSIDTAGAVADGVINNAEHADGITLTGIVEAGSSVSATFGSATKAATVNADGTWSVTFAAGEIPGGTYDADVTITATDAAGNTASITESFAVDTDAPDAADVTGFIEVQNDTAGAIIRATSDVLDAETDVSIHQVGESGTDAAVEIAASGSEVGSNIYYGFDNDYVVPNGSHLVVEKEDAAGNTNATMMVLDVNGDDNVDVSASTLDAFDIGAIDLEHAENSTVDLSTADLEAMSKNDNILVIHGRDTDTVNLEGLATATGSETINGKSYDVYSVGSDGGQLIINSEIEFNQTIV